MKSEEVDHFELFASLANAISRIRKRKELLEFIVREIQPIFGFNEHTNIAVLNASGTGLSLFFTDIQEEDREVQSVERVLAGVPIEGVFKTILYAEEPCLLSEQWKYEEKDSLIDQMAVQPWFDLGLKSSLSYRLKCGGELIGSWHVHYYEDKQFTSEDIALFKSVTDVIALTVSNILAHEEVMQRQREKDLLLSLSEVLSKVRHKQDLIDILMGKIKLLIAFDELPTLFVVDDKLENYYIYYHKLFEAKTESQELSAWKRRRVPIEGDPVATKLVFEDRIQVLQLKDSKEKWPDHPGVKIAEDLGLWEAIHIPLHSRGRLIGLLSLNAYKEGNFSSVKPEIAKAVGELVANALANILANEEIMARENEKAALLKISTSINNVRKNEDIPAVLFHLVRQLVDVDEIVITQYDDSLSNFRDYFTMTSPEIASSEVFSRNVGKWHAVTGTPHEIAIGIVNDPNGAIPMVADLTAIADTYPVFYGFRICEMLGYKTSTNFGLFYGSRLIGVIGFLSRNPASFQSEKLSFYQSVANITATALSNITANEDILRREEEKAKLLSISQELAAIRNADSLFSIIYDKLKPIFYFDDAVVVLFSEDAKYTRHIHTFNESTVTSRTDSYTAITAQNWPVSGTPYEEIAQMMVPEIVDLAPWKQKYPDHPGIRVAIESGLMEAVFMPLFYAGNLIGTFEFHATAMGRFGAHHLPLYNNLANQMAVALANILANEEIKARDHEKTVLLSLSEDIASIRDREELWQVMMNKIKPMVGFDDAVVIRIAEDKKTSNTMLTLARGERTKKEWYSRIFQKWIVISPPLADIYQLGTAYWSTSEMLNRWPDFAGFVFMRDEGLMHTYQVALSQGGQQLGLLLLHFTEKERIDESKFGLYKAIADQVAVAVANILANEEINERKEEKSVMLGISEALSRVNTRQDLYDLLVQQLQPVFNFDSLNVCVLGKKAGHHTLFIASPYTDIPAAAEELQHFFQREVLNAGSPLEILLSKPELLYLTLEEGWLRDYPDYIGTQLSVLTSTRFSVCISLELAHDIIGCLMVHYVSPIGEWDDRQISIFRNSAKQVAVALDRILRIEQLELKRRQSQLMLRISQQLVSANSKERLCDFLFDEMQPLFQFDDAVMVLVDPERASVKHIKDYAKSPLRKLESASHARMMKETLVVRGTPYEDHLKLRKPTILQTPEYLKANFPRYAGLNIVRDLGIEESIYIPLIAGADVIGTIELHNTEKGRFSEELFPLFENIANQIAIALLNVSANEKLLSKAQEVETLNKQLQGQNEYLIEEVESQYNLNEFIGQSPQIVEVYQQIGRVAKSDSTVLILGETGTGKELVARAIHNLSNRTGKPLIKINCAALPAQLIESELFGHERGAFTGAIDRRIGKFELANGSTLFLDEVGELPIELQSKLLRTLQEKEIERLGSNKVIKTDVRIIAATNRDLSKEVAAGRFRSDLFYRLNVFPITLPPLRERKADINLLVAHFINKMGKKAGKSIQGLSNQALQELASYDWPGNIREMEHIIERAILMSSGKIIQKLHLPGGTPAPVASAGAGQFLLKPYREMERDYLLFVLNQCKGKIYGPGGAAEVLELPPSNVQYKMKILGIEKVHVASGK